MGFEWRGTFKLISVNDPSLGVMPSMSLSTSPSQLLYHRPHPRASRQIQAPLTRIGSRFEPDRTQSHRVRLQNPSHRPRHASAGDQYPSATLCAAAFPAEERAQAAHAVSPRVFISCIRSRRLMVPS